MKRLDDGSWRCADPADCEDIALDREYVRYMASQCAAEPPKEVGEPDPEVTAAFVAAMNAQAAFKAMSKPGVHYLAWTGVPGGDWAGPVSLTSRERSSARWCRESARFRRQRVCLRAHPSDGPPLGGRCREVTYALVRSGP
jgi:hypothetical protein